MFAGYAAGWSGRDLDDLEHRIRGLLIVVSRYLRQPLEWALEQPRSWLALLGRETIELMKKERQPLGG